MDREKRDCYRLGTFLFEIRHTGVIPFPPFLERFRAAKTEKPSHVFELVLTDRLPQPQGKQITHRADLDVYEAAGSRSEGGEVREVRLLRFVGAPMAYGYYEEKDEHYSRSFLQRDFVMYSQIDTVFYSLFALERHLLGEKGLILHCSMLRVGAEVLLFSGPSGVGKSTHADLWRSHFADTEVINGDRALLQWESGHLIAHSWCVSGSSKICINQSFPVRGIIFLQQEAENGGVLLRGLGAVKRIISQITVNNWNPQAVECAWELAERITQEIPVYDYGCNMEPEAVTALRQLLGMNGDCV